MFKTLAVMVMLVLAGMVDASPARADFYDGNRLYRHCTASQSSATYYQEDANCIGYIAGAYDGIMTGGLTAAVYWNLPDHQYPLCVPDNVDLGQIRDVVIKYLRENPSDRHHSASLIVFWALIKVFPCN